nr:S8 family peptidase [Saprospiraceae bacterium]
MKLFVKISIHRLLIVILCLSANMEFTAAQHQHHQIGLHVDDWLIVQFEDPVKLQWNEGLLLTARSADYSDSFHALIRENEWKWPYQSTRENLQNIRRELIRRNSSQNIPNIVQRFYLKIPEGLEPNEFLSELRVFSEIAYAYPIPKPVPPANAPDFDANQGYLNSSVDGIGARDLWENFTIRGGGIKVVDIEYNFNPNHRDLPPIEIIGGLPYNRYGDNHGTAVMGQLGALDNGWGVTGMVPDATFYFHYSFNEFNFLDIGSAVVNSAMAIEEGDVILIEAQTTGPYYDPNEGGQYGLMPVEWFKPWYDDIVFAVNMGRIVVLAGGNGAQNLDEEIYAQNPFHTPFKEGHNSGAIIVGAGAAPGSFNGSRNARSRLPFSNYGSRVDLQGWGERIYTTGYGSAYNNGDRDLFFTKRFGGTSGASPMVTSAVALVQSAVKNFRDTILSGAEISELLKTTGAPQQSGSFPASQQIGPFPNVAAALALLGIEECEPKPPIDFIVHQACAPLSVGSILIDTTHFNHSGYSLSWNTGDSSLFIDDLPEGIYHLTLVDSNRCKRIYSQEIKELHGVDLTYEKTNEICPEGNNGSLVVHLNETHSPYFIQLNGNEIESGQVQTNLSPGTYQIVAENAFGCILELEIELEKAPLKTLDIMGLEEVIQQDKEYLAQATIQDFQFFFWEITNGSILSGQGSPLVRVSWHKPDTQQLHLKAIDSNFCITKQEIEVFVDFPSNTTDGDPDPNLLMVYPNPTSDYLYLKNVESHRIQIGFIYNLEGQRVKTISDTHPIDINELTAGKYIIEIQSQKGIVRLPFIKVATKD